MTRNNHTIAMMESAGYKPYSNSKPGVYVRNATSPQKVTIDWDSEPTELLESMRVQLKNITVYPRAEIVVRTVDKVNS